MTAGPETTTRQRIIQAALRLFAEQGYHGTTVGEIEAAAGLTPRAGALYRHFASKEAVLEAAMQERSEAIDEIVTALDHLPLGDLRAELRLIARVALHELAEERLLLRVLMKEGDRFPRLREEFFDRLVRRGFDQARAYLDRACDRYAIEVSDPAGLAAVVLGSVVHFHLLETIFGRPPPGVDQDRFVEAWVDASMAILRPAGAGAILEPQEATT